MHLNHVGLLDIPFPFYYVNIVPLVLCVGLIWFYNKGIKNNPNPSYKISRWRKISFHLSIVALFLSLEPPIDLYADDSFIIHQIQHALIRMIFPPLFLLGNPVTPLLRGVPNWAFNKIFNPIMNSRGVNAYYNFITKPLVTVILYMLILYVWQVSFIHNLSVENIYVHQIMHITMIVSSLLFWWLMIDSHPHQSRLHYGLRILFLGLLIFPNTFLGSLITFSGTAFYTAYDPLNSPIPVSLITDQRIGGLILWMSGDMMNVIAAAVIMGVWYNKEEGKSTNI